MNQKAKGSNTERELISMFWSTGCWSAMRAAGSGCSRYPSPDLVAGNSIRRLAIECKSSAQENIYIPKEEIENLETFCRLFGAEAWIGVRFNKKEWFFLSLEDIKQTSKNYTISTALARSRGLLFEEMIK